MAFDGLVRDLRRLFLDDSDPLRSLLNLATFFLIGWALIPEAIYYDWLLWAGAAGLWSLLVLAQARTKLIAMVLRQRLWLIAVWPAYTLILWLMGKGVLHRKFVAVAFMIAVPFYYILSHRKKDLAALARLGILLMSLIALTTLVQMLTHPNIARELAVGRGTGNFRASALLGNFHTVYEGVLLSITLGGLFVMKQLHRANWRMAVIFALNLALVLFARYDIALIALSAGAVMLLILRWTREGKGTEQGLSDQPGQPSGHQPGYHPVEQPAVQPADQVSGRTKDRAVPALPRFPFRELAGTTALYLLPALLVLVFRPLVDGFIDQMDYKTLDISEKLFNRIWVYLRSLFLFTEYPLLGFGVQPDPTQFLSGQHSDYLEILAEYGLVGFLVFLTAWLALLLTLRDHLPVSRRGIFWIAVITFHILFILNPVLEVSSVTMLFLILPGILMEPMQAGDHRTPNFKSSEEYDHGATSVKGKRQ